MNNRRDSGTHGSVFFVMCPVILRMPCFFSKCCSFFSYSMLYFRQFAHSKAFVYPPDHCSIKNYEVSWLYIIQVHTFWIVCWTHWVTVVVDNIVISCVIQYIDVIFSPCTCEFDKSIPFFYFALSLPWSSMVPKYAGCHLSEIKPSMSGLSQLPPPSWSRSTNAIHFVKKLFQ